MPDLAWIDAVATGDIPDVLGALETARAKLQARLIRASVQAATPRPTPQVVDRYLRIAHAAELVGRSISWMQKHGQTLPGYRKLHAHRSEWSERALRDYAAQTVGAPPSLAGASNGGRDAHGEDD